MGSVVEIGGVAGWAAIAAPLLLMAAALMLALFWPYRADATAGDHGWHEPAAPPTAPPATPPESSISNSGQPRTGTEALHILKEPTEPLTQPLPHAASGDVTTTTATEDKPIEVTSSDVRQRSASAAPSAKTETAAARALLDEALGERAAGNDAAAAECLRGAIMLAAKSGDRTLHAACRLELGDIVQAEGDLQTACEHWQMARSLFDDEQRAAEAAKCEKRMIQNRCPTDWVLNDF